MKGYVRLLFRIGIDRYQTVEYNAKQSLMMVRGEEKKEKAERPKTENNLANMHALYLLSRSFFPCHLSANALAL